MTDYPPIPYTARDLRTIQSELAAWILKTHPDVWSDFVESALGTALRDLVAFVGDILNFSVNQVSREVFLATAQRYATALRIARSVGYDPTGPVAASVDVTASSLPAALASYPLVVAKGAQISAGEATFETLQQFTFPAGSVAVSFAMAEGTSQIELFTSTGDADQTFDTSEISVIEDSWEVQVDSVTWTEVDSLATAGLTNSYTAEYFGNDSQLRIRFGDGTFGNVPLVGAQIKITYRSGGGTVGNVAAGAIDGVIQADCNGTISLPISNLTAAAGGADREDIEDMRRDIPVYIRTQDRAITKADFDDLSRGFSDPSAGEIGRASTILRVSSYSANIVDVYAWAESGDTFVAASSALRDALWQYLYDRAVITVTVCIQPGNLQLVNFDLGTVYVDSNYDKDTVGDNIDTALKALFTRDENVPGGSLYISEVYKAVMGVDGVDQFTLTTPAADVNAADDTTLLVIGTITKTMDYTPVPTPTPSGAC